MQTHQHALDLYPDSVRAKDMTEQEWAIYVVCKWRRERLIESARRELTERKINHEGED